LDRKFNKDSKNYLNSHFLTPSGCDKQFVSDCQTALKICNNQSLEKFSAYSVQNVFLRFIKIILTVVTWLPS